VQARPWSRPSRKPPHPSSADPGPQAAARGHFSCKRRQSTPIRAPSAAPRAGAPGSTPGPPGSIARVPPREAEEGTLAGQDPHYDAQTDTYRRIYRGHDNASAVTNTKGVTVYFDPDTNDVLGFAIVNFSAYYREHVTPEGEFTVDLPTKIPANLEEEMDFDAEAARTGVRIAEFY
jgi:hypothetical protein